MVLAEWAARQAAGVAAIVAQAASGDTNPAPTYALAGAIATLAGALGLVGKWMMAEISRLNSKLLDTAVPAMQASTIATNNMVDVARQLSAALSESERDKTRLELELDQVRRRRNTHPEGT